MTGMQRRDWAVVLLCWGLATAYNLDKAFHIDDTVHLEIAQWIVGHPLHPMQGVINWSGSPEPIFQTNQPHLYFYLLAAWGGLFSFSERSVHVMQSLFTLAAIVLFLGLSRALAPRLAIPLTILMALSPAFLVGQNAMVDVALLAAWLAFFRSLLLGIGCEAQMSRYVSMAVFASVASMIKYSSLVLILVLAISLVVERRPRLSWVLAVPGGVLLLWSLFNLWDVGEVHLLARPPSDFSAWINGVRWVVTLGGLLPLGLMVLTMEGVRRNQRWTTRAWLAALLLWAVLTVGVLWGALPDGLADRMLFLGFLVNGLVLVIWVGSLALADVRPVGTLRMNGKRLVSFYLIIWVVATTAFYVVLTPFVASRHVLLILPPLLLLFGRAYAEARGAVLFLGVASTVLVTAGLGASDWRFADYYRRSATEIASMFPASARVWTNGHWGWQWYSGLAGMRQVDISRDEFESGDYYVVAEDVHNEPLDFPADLLLVKEIPGGRDAFSIMCTARDARFYVSSQYGPWSISNECLGSFSIYRVLKGPSKSNATVNGAAP